MSPIWVANREIESASEQASQEFLRTQRQAAFAELLAELWKVDRAILDCVALYETQTEPDPPGEDALWDSSLSAGTSSSLKEITAMVVASPVTEKLIEDLSAIRYDAIQHCQDTMSFDDPHLYADQVSQLKNDYEILRSLIDQFLPAAQDDIGNFN